MPTSSISGTRFRLEGANRVIEIPSDEVVTLFEGVTIKRPSIAQNEFGLWSLATVGNKGKILYNSFQQPKHILQARNGCVWNPKMKITQVGGKITLSDYTVNGEICPDAFWDNSFEKLFGTGLEIRDLLATPEGSAVWNVILAKIFASMHNSVYDVMYYGDHTQVDASLAGSWFPGDPAEFLDFKDQMAVSDGGGVLTQLDGLRDLALAQYSHLNGAIAAGDVSGADYTGGTNAITVYLDNVIANAHDDLQTVHEQNNEDVLILAAPAEFEALEAFYMAQYNNIPEAYLYYIKNESGAMQAAQNVLKYKGKWVIKMNGWKRFDRIVGVNNHRILAVARGVFGGVYDVASVPGQSWVGMRIDQRMGGGSGHMGKIYLLSDFKLGTEILDTNLVSMYTIVDTP